MARVGSFQHRDGTRSDVVALRRTDGLYRIDVTAYSAEGYYRPEHSYTIRAGTEDELNDLMEKKGGTDASIH